MRRMDAPIASRWASIVLRRALMSPLDTPANINGADFAADRAWALLRMGEANAARAVIDDVDTDNYTTWLYQVAMQAALATGDPAAFCPLADKAAAVIQQRGWALAQAMCLGLAGKPNEAGQLLSRGAFGDEPVGHRQSARREGARHRRAGAPRGDDRMEFGEPAHCMALGAGDRDGRRGAGGTLSDRGAAGPLLAGTGTQYRSGGTRAPRPSWRRRRACSPTPGWSISIRRSSRRRRGPGQTVARDLRTAYTDGDVNNRGQGDAALWDAGETAAHALCPADPDRARGFVDPGERQGARIPTG
jgi:hypothetical protein